ncbi:MAG: class I SAM-dependent methyltransferase [Proteobacteria bacterium]|nr:class I SAM-dependent methyltransferase [Pseudomonadota bacterium]
MMNLDRFLAVYDTVPPAYYRWMLDLLRPHLRSPVLEIGSGPGIVTRLLLDGGWAVTGLDCDKAAAERLSQMLGDREGFSMLEADATQTWLGGLPGAPFATVLCLNVLEHVSDDLGFLKNLYGALAPGGNALVLVPAHPCLFGPLDEEFGHFRRYRRRDLERLMSLAGFRCQVRPFNLLGAAGWWWRFKVLKRKDFSTSQNRIYAGILPLARALEAFVRIPTGLSLIAVGEKD